MAASEESEVIANEAALEAFSKAPAEQRQLTAELKGVLAETACTGVIRYKWHLIQPLLVQLMQQQLRDFESAEHVDVGPARPLLPGDDSVEALCERFAGLLQAFQGPPWTLQRLCELLLEPRKQYQRLHKLAPALEKLLLVTSEQDVTQDPGPAPRLSQLTRVNEAPVSAAGSSGAAAVGQKRQRQEEAEAGGLVAAALTVKQQPGAAQQQQQREQQADDDAAEGATHAAGRHAAAAPAAAAAAAANDAAAAAAGPAAMDVDSEGDVGRSTDAVGNGEAAASKQPSAAAAAADAPPAEAAAGATTAATDAAAKEPGSIPAAAEQAGSDAKADAS